MAGLLLRGFMGEDEGFESDDSPPRLGHCELPVARERREALGPPGDHGGCQICALTDEASRNERMPPSIERFRRALRTQPDHLPETEACKLLSSLFNRTCVRFDRASANPVGLREISPRDVQLHLQETQHLRANEDRMLDDSIWYTLKTREQLERGGLWHSVGGAAQLDYDGFAAWTKLMDSLRKQIELRHRMRTAREGGVQKRKSAPRPHFSRLR